MEDASIDSFKVEKFTKEQFCNVWETFLKNEITKRRKVGSISSFLNDFAGKCSSRSHKEVIPKEETLTWHLSWN